MDHTFFFISKKSLPNLGFVEIKLIFLYVALASHNLSILIYY